MSHQNGVGHPQCASCNPCGRQNGFPVTGVVCRSKAYIDDKCSPVYRQQLSPCHGNDIIKPEQNTGHQSDHRQIDACKVDQHKLVKPVVSSHSALAGYDNGHIPPNSDICASLSQVLTTCKAGGGQMMRPFSSTSPCCASPSKEWISSDRNNRTCGKGPVPDSHAKHHQHLHESKSGPCPGGAVLCELNQALQTQAMPPPQPSVVSKVKANRQEIMANENHAAAVGFRPQRQQQQFRRRPEQGPNKNRCPSESRSFTDSDFSSVASERSDRKPPRRVLQGRETMTLAQTLGTTTAGCVLHGFTLLLALIAIIVAALAAGRSRDNGQIVDTEALLQSSQPLQQRVASLEAQLQAPGPQQPGSIPPDLQRRLQVLERQVTGQPQSQSPQDTSSGSQMVIYTRWGRRSCSTMSVHAPPVMGLGPMPGMPGMPMTRPHGGNRGNAAQLLYEGVAGGSQRNQNGGGANMMCLPLTPTWGNYSDLLEGQARLSGAEYRLGQAEGSFNVFENTQFAGRLNLQKVPCAICQVRRASSVIMIPASLTCPIGWLKQYHGYLLSERDQRSEFVCVDHQAEPSPHYRFMPGMQNEGMTLYPVEASCGSLPCSPYVSQREVTCVVCTR